MNEYRKELLRELGSKVYGEATKGYDILGNIAVIDAKGATAKKIAKVVMGINRNVKTVVRKEGAVRGRYRTRDYVHVMGKRNFIATYRENGAVFTFDIRKTFFSTRLAYERKRIVDLSRNGENVIVMFAGAGPFAVEIARKNRDSEVIAIELNKQAYKYMLDNISKNKTGNVAAVNGDVKKAVKEYRGFADRIIMPLPMESHRYLQAANYAARRGCVIHYYAFGDIKKPYKKNIDLLKEVFAKREVKIMGKRIVRPYSSRESEIVIDARLAL